MTARWLWLAAASASAGRYWARQPGLDQLELAGPADRLAAVSHRQLAVDVLEVRLDGVDGEVHLVSDLSGVQHAREVPQHLPFAVAERLGRTDHGRILHPRRGWELIVTWGLCEQPPVTVGEPGILPQYRPEPAALQDE